MAVCSGAFQHSSHFYAENSRRRPSGNTEKLSILNIALRSFALEFCWTFVIEPSRARHKTFNFSEPLVAKSHNEPDTANVLAVFTIAK